MSKVPQPPVFSAVCSSQFGADVYEFLALTIFCDIVTSHWKYAVNFSPCTLNFGCTYISDHIRTIGLVYYLSLLYVHQIILLLYISKTGYSIFQHFIAYKRR